MQNILEKTMTTTATRSATRRDLSIYVPNLIRLQDKSYPHTIITPTMHCSPLWGGYEHGLVNVRLPDLLNTNRKQHKLAWAVALQTCAQGRETAGFYQDYLRLYFKSRRLILRYVEGGVTLEQYDELGVIKEKRSPFLTFGYRFEAK